MLKWKLTVLVVSLVVVGCARYGQPHISAPQNGQKIVLEDTACFDVLLDDSEYRDSTIEVRGHELFNGDLTCRMGMNSPATCCRSYQYQYYQNRNWYYENCVESRPCQLTIIARRDDRVDVVNITVVRYKETTTTPTTPQ